MEGFDGTSRMENQLRTLLVQVIGVCSMSRGEDVSPIGMGTQKAMQGVCGSEYKHADSIPLHDHPADRA